MNERIFLYINVYFYTYNTIKLITKNKGGEKL